MKRMTERKVQKQIREMMRRETKTLEKRVISAFKSGAIPEDWKSRNDYLIAMAILDGWMSERGFQPNDRMQRRAFAEIHRRTY